MKKISILLFFLNLLVQTSFGQVYIEKQTRHRFAQLNMGVDLESSFLGNTSYFDQQGTINTAALQPSYNARFLIGGTHFWGHADFYIAIPLLYPKVKVDNQEIQHLRGVETAFKYYPWRIKQHKIRPFIGFSIAPFSFKQNNNSLEFGKGPELSRTKLPLLSGFTYNHKQHLLELGMTWNHSNKQHYHISRSQETTIKMPPIYANISYRYMLETTISAEKNWESGRIQEVTKQLAEAKKLNGFYLGVGLSSAFWLGESSYNTSQKPYLGDYGISIMPDFTAGYYWHNIDLNAALGYRVYGTSTDAYGTVQNLKRQSILLEMTKYLFDYHGFVPFVGPAISYENINFVEDFESQNIHRISDNKISYALTFGWDIRPTRLQSWILRTNLRYYPNLKLNVTNTEQISFNNLEFNFIQLIIYPNRMWGKKS